MKNNITYVVGLVVLAVVAVGGVWYARGGSSMSAVDKSDQSGQSLRQLVASKAPVECVINEVAEQTKTQGTVVVAGGKLRGDFISTVQASAGEQKVDSHIVVENSDIYIWSNLSKMGVKTKVIPEGDPRAKAGQGIDLDRKLSYQCKPWTADQTKFARPAEIKFSSLEELMGAAASQPAQ